MEQKTFPQPRALWLVKITRRAKAACKLFIENAFAPLFDKQSLLALFAFFFGLHIIFSSEGLLATATELHKNVKDTIPFIYAYPLYLFFCLIWAIRDTFKEERRKGHWSGYNFIFNEPLLLASIRVSGNSQDNRTSFRIEECEPGGWVEIKAVIEGFEQNVKVSLSPIASTPSIPWEHIQSGGAYQLAIVPEDKTFYLSAYIQNTNFSIVKVYLMSSNVQQQ